MENFIEAVQQTKRWGDLTYWYLSSPYTFDLVPWLRHAPFAMTQGVLLEFLRSEGIYIEQVPLFSEQYSKPWGHSWRIWHLVERSGEDDKIFIPTGELPYEDYNEGLQKVILRAFDL